LALKQYADYIILYSKIDYDKNKKLSYDEFLHAKDLLEKWTGSVPDMKKAFNIIDWNRNGEIDFDEFCDWAILKNFNFQQLEEDDRQEYKLRKSNYIIKFFCYILLMII